MQSRAASTLRSLGVWRVADGVWQLTWGPQGSPLPNCFFLASHASSASTKQADGAGVLIDSGTIACGSRLLHQLSVIHANVSGGQGPAIAGHAVTHAHPDHTGSSRRVCTHLGAPFWVGEGDEAVASGRKSMEVGPAESLIRGLPHNLVSGASHPVDHVMKDGDELFDTGFVAVASPGHTPGHFAFWRKEDRVLICGDTMANFRWISRVPGFKTGFSLPPYLFSHDDGQNRRSLLRLAQLGPRVALFGHGNPFVNSGEIEEYAEQVQWR